MKRIISLLTVFLLALALACPAFAAEGFVPSISDKEEPDIVPDDEGILGVIRNADGEVIGQIGEGCLVITPISEAEESTEIPEDAREELLDVYKELTEGSMTLPYEEDGLNPEDMVIRDLIDASWLCEDHPELVEEEGVTAELTFDIGVDDDIPVYVYVFVDGEWVKTESAVNNGDGTVTVVFEKLCPIAFCVPADADTPPAQTGDAAGNQMFIWVAVMAVSAVALCAMVVLRRRNAR